MDKENLLEIIKEETSDETIKIIIDTLGDLSLSSEELLKIFVERGIISFKPVE